MWARLDLPRLTATVWMKINHEQFFFRFSPSIFLLEARVLKLVKSQHYKKFLIERSEKSTLEILIGEKILESTTDKREK